MWELNLSVTNTPGFYRSLAPGKRERNFILVHPRGVVNDCAACSRLNIDGNISHFLPPVRTSYSGTAKSFRLRRMPPNPTGSKNPVGARARRRKRMRPYAESSLWLIFPYSRIILVL
jgi:hypothetical protein